MNKKFLSVALFGALLAVSSGTFTSCKDYDDDINSLNDRVDAVEKSLSELKTQFGSLAYVKAVSITNGKLVVTDQNGKDVTFDIPVTENTNTTYTLGVKQEGNKVTVTLTPSEGKAQEFSFEITDNDTKFDATRLWKDADGKVYYGPNGDLENSKETGVVVPNYEQHDKTTVSIGKIIENEATLGWIIQVDKQEPVKLLIQDVLPITGFAWIPEDYYNGIEAVSFGSYEYNVIQKTAANVADTTYTANGDATLSSFPGVAKFHINPSSATLAQIKNGAEGATVLYKGATNHTTRSAKIDPEATIAIADGILTASITADLNEAETAADKLDMLALQMTTTTGNKFTTNYFAVYNEKKTVSFTLVDKCNITNNTVDSKNVLATSWNAVTGQVAKIDADNIADASNAHLVQALEYEEAIKGVDLNTLVNVVMTKDGKAEKIDLATNKLSIEYLLCKYTVNGTEQMNYAKLDKSVLTAVNYGDINMSCIGKTPIVKAIVKDANNGDAVVAVAYIKLLYVGDKWEVSDNFVAEPSKTLEIDWNCFDDPDLDYTSTVEYMSTKVYPMVGSKLGLDALSKEEFANIYTFVDDQVNIPDEDLTSRYFTSITEKAGAEDNADNRQIVFNVDEEAIKNIQKDGTYTFYGVYKKNDAASEAASKYRQYPEFVAIPYVVKVKNYPTVANGRIKDIKNFRIEQAWENGYAICKGSKETVKGAALYLDLKEAVDLDKFKADYAGYELEIVDPTAPLVPVAELGSEWYTGGNSNWIVLTKQLVDGAEEIVPVNVYAILCNTHRILAGTVNVKFINPARLAMSKTTINVKDGLKAYNTQDLKSYITITSSKDGSVLYDGSKTPALTEIGKRILGENPAITLTKGAVNPTQWGSKFTLNDDGTVTWNLEGQNTLAKGQNATCEVTFAIEYGKVVPADLKINGVTASTPALGGGKLTGKFTIKAWNADEFPGE
ncbi:hypothetical protein [Bacteroides bouchesdurhonensis]|uniref:hypothetical protein n=1 Tax=Bacteroides bouchesdurhonensis TaxID=1841855 RepID=UPI0011DE44A4|nr:hypothetical protein [Bacteroides bouchesdurhonensis]